MVDSSVLFFCVTMLTILTKEFRNEGNPFDGS